MHEAKSDRSSAYAKALSRVPDMGNQQEAELYRRWCDDKDIAARDALVASSLKIAVAVAHKFCARQSDFDDYVSAGSVGAVKALKHFDPSRGVSFRAYAWHWIRAEVNLMYMRNKFIATGGSCLRTDILFRVNRLRARIESTTLDREKVCAGIAAEMKTSPKVVRGWLDRLDQGDLSLDYAYEDADSTMLDRLQATDTSPEDGASEAEHDRRVKGQIRTALKALTEREREIVQRRYLNHRIETLQEIGDSMGICRERTRQIEAHALQKLRETIVLDGYSDNPAQLGRLVRLFVDRFRKKPTKLACAA